MLPYHDVHDTRSIMECITKGPPRRPSNEFTCSRMTDPWWDMCNLCWIRDESSRPSIADIATNITTIVCVMFSAYVLFMTEYLQSQSKTDFRQGIFTIVHVVYTYFFRSFF